jgi:hypothetical protein
MGRLAMHGAMPPPGPNAPLPRVAVPFWPVVIVGVGVVGWLLTVLMGR